METTRKAPATRTLRALAAACIALALVACCVVPAGAAVAATETDAANATAVSAQASGLATAKAKAVNTTVKKNAATIVKKAGAKSGTALDKLDKIYSYIATDKKFGGTFTFPSSGYLFFFMKAAGNANAKYYPASQPQTLKGFYKKYAIDAFKTKQASCHHYAALFAVAAKQALGNKATVRLALQRYQDDGSTQVHAWAEVTVGGKTYIYDTQKGNLNSKNANNKADFGDFCGSEKSSMASTYRKYTGVKYCTVTL